jgi:hypothetical protein
LDLGFQLFGGALGQELTDEPLVLGLGFVAALGAEIDVPPVDDDAGLAARHVESDGF